MEKAGARNSKADATRIQTIHDQSCELGAACADASAEKAHTLEEENDRLAKSVDKASAGAREAHRDVEELKKSNAKMAARSRSSRASRS
jgi:hypothetical protein